MRPIEETTESKMEELSPEEEKGWERHHEWLTRMYKEAETKEVQMPKEEKEIVVRPEHYARNVIEPVEFIMKNKINFAKGNAIKYLVRAGYKLYEGKDSHESELTDLNKAKRYIEMEINRINGKDIL